MENGAKHTEIPDSKLLEAEDNYAFSEQIGRADSEARAQVAEKILATGKCLNYFLFAFIAVAMTIDQYNTAKGYYHYQIVSDKLLGGLIAGVVVEIAMLAFCLGRMPFLKRRPENQ
ncbi:hypothetical protein ACC668_16485 [Rhizobium ruizarguesonis]